MSCQPYMFKVSADSITYNLHSILECLDRLRQTVYDLILLIESLVHFVLQLLSQSHEFSH